MDSLKDYTKLQAWSKAMDLAVKIQNAAKLFPSDERYALCDQMRRAALSVPANIAEGFGRFTYPDKHHKYIQARGELIELMTFLHYSRRVEYLQEESFSSLMLLCTEVHKLLNGLIAKMQSLIPKP
jgi:four helix bundle protein